MRKKEAVRVAARPESDQWGRKVWLHGLRRGHEDKRADRGWAG